MERRGGLETFKFPVDKVLAFGLVVFGADVGLFAVDIECPELTITRLLPINSIDETFGGHVDPVINLQ